MFRLNYSNLPSTPLNTTLDYSERRCTKKHRWDTAKTNISTRC